MIVHEGNETTTVFEQNPMKIMQKLNENRKTGKSCDVTIKIDNKRYACHRLILMSSVPYFETMFSVNLIERDKNEINLNYVDSDAFGIILDYVYTGVLKFQIDPISNVVIMTTTCDYLGLLELSDECRKLCKKLLNVDNIFEVCSSIETYPDHPLIESSAEFIVRNFREICRMNEFVRIPYNILMEVIRDDFLSSTDEYTILVAVNRWLVMRRPEERIRYLDKLAGAIRYSFIKDDLLVGQEKQQTHEENKECLSLIEKVRSIRIIDNENNFQRIFRRRVGVRLYFFGRCSDSNNSNNNNNNNSRSNYNYDSDSDDDDNNYVIDVLRYNGDTFERIPEMRTEIIGKHYQRVIISSNRFYSLVRSRRMMKNYFQSYDDQNEKRWQQLRNPGHGFQVYNMASIDCLNCIYANCSLDSDFVNTNICCYVKDRDQWDRVKDGTDETQDKQLCSQSMISYNNVLYAFGGFNRRSCPSDRTCFFDPRIGTWITLRSMPKKRGFTAVSNLNDRMYLTGGSNGLAYSRELHVFKTLSIYDIRADKWVPASSMINCMYRHQSIMYDDRMWCIEGSAPYYINIYCPKKNQWTNYVGPAISNLFETDVAVVPY